MNKKTKQSTESDPENATPAAAEEPTETEALVSEYKADPAKVTEIYGLLQSIKHPNHTTPMNVLVVEKIEKILETL